MVEASLPWPVAAFLAVVVVIGWFGPADEVFGSKDRIHGTGLASQGKLIEDPPGSGRYRPRRKGER